MVVGMCEGRQMQAKKRKIEGGGWGGRREGERERGREGERE